MSIVVLNVGVPSIVLTHHRVLIAHSPKDYELAISIEAVITGMVSDIAFRSVLSPGLRTGPIKKPTT